MPMTEPRPFHDPLMLEMSLRSDINGRDYDLRIRLPQGYSQGDGRHPVMVVLDAEFMFYLVSEIAPLEAMWSHAPLSGDARAIPEVIVVSVALPGDDPVRRNFEYMPPCDEGDFSPSVRAYLQRVTTMMGRTIEFGGAASFLRVLRDEILPSIDVTFRTDASRRMLVGISASGCFAAFALLTDPSLFTDYAIISPMVTAGVFRMEAAWAESHDDLPARVLLTAGELELRDPMNIVSGATRLAENLGGRGYRGLRLDTLIVPGATHIQTAAPSISRALAALGKA